MQLRRWQKLFTIQRTDTCAAACALGGSERVTHWAVGTPGPRRGNAAPAAHVRARELLYAKIRQVHCQTAGELPAHRACLLASHVPYWEYQPHPTPPHAIKPHPIPSHPAASNAPHPLPPYLLVVAQFAAAAELRQLVVLLPQLAQAGAVGAGRLALDGRLEVLIALDGGLGWVRKVREGACKERGVAASCSGERFAG